MDVYNIEEANFLIEYFVDLLVGLSIEPPNEIIITGIESRLVEDGNYRVICRVNEHQGVTIIDDIANVAELHGIISPQEALEQM